MAMSLQFDSSSDLSVVLWSGGLVGCALGFWRLSHHALRWPTVMLSLISLPVGFLLTTVVADVVG